MASTKFEVSMEIFKFQGEPDVSVTLTGESPAELDTALKTLETIAKTTTLYNGDSAPEAEKSVTSEPKQAAPTIDPETLRPVAHWEEIPGSYEVCAGETGSWCVPATRCSNPECGEVNPCGLKTPFCPMCGFRMEDVPYDDD